MIASTAFPRSEWWVQESTVARDRRNLESRLPNGPAWAWSSPWLQVAALCIERRMNQVTLLKPG